MIGRNATKSAFETFWRGGTPLPSNVVYLNSADTHAGDQRLRDLPAHQRLRHPIDGPTIAMAVRRREHGPAQGPVPRRRHSTSWTISASSNGTPGSGAAAGCAKGVVINEFSDALGTNNFVYEFVELHNDQ